MFRLISESLLRFPNLWDLVPNYFRLVAGMAYTVFGASMIFVTYYVRVPSAKNRTALQSWQWPALILIPVSYATGTLILGLDHLIRYGLPLLSTVRQAIMGDPWFFAFYTVIVCATLLWPVMAGVSKAHREGR